MQPSGEEQFQKQYFNVTAHQYPRAAILRPPLHTALETQRVLDRLQGVPVGEPIVDFGSGTGRLSIALAKAGYAVLSVDVSDQSLSMLSTLARELDLPAIQTALALPADRQFAAIVGSDILHHVDMDGYLPRIYAALRQGGKAIFSEPGAMNPTWYLYLPLFHDMRAEKRIVTCNVFTLRRKFKQHGFRDVHIAGLGLLPRPLLGWASIACQWHDAIGDWPVLRWFAYRYIVEASK